MTRTCVASPATSVGTSARTAGRLSASSKAGMHTSTPPHGSAARRLELGGRQRPDEPAHALVGAIGPAEGVESEQVRDRDRDDQDRDEPAERLALETERVLDGSDEVRERARPRTRPIATTRRPLAGTRLPAPRRRSRPIATSRRTTAKARSDEAQEADRHARPVYAACQPASRGSSRPGPRLRRSSGSVAAAGSRADVSPVPAASPVCRSGAEAPRALRQGQADADDRERDSADTDEQQRVVERGRDHVAEEPGQQTGPEPAGDPSQRPAVARTNAIPSRPDDRAFLREQAQPFVVRRTQERVAELRPELAGRRGSPDRSPARPATSRSPAPQAWMRYSSVATRTVPGTTAHPSSGLRSCEVARQQQALRP